MINPNNPTGSVCTRETLEGLIELARTEQGYVITTRELDDAISTLRDQGMNRLMLDLRGNEVIPHVLGNITDCGIGHECNPFQVTVVITYEANMAHKRSK